MYALAVFLPLIGAALAGLFGRWLKDEGAQAVSCGAMVLAAIIGTWAFFDVALGGNIHTIDVLIYGDARELEVALQTQFPNSSIKVFRYSESLILKGIIDQPEHATPIMRIAEDYAPKVINNMTVGGAQQVLLKVRILEVSRTGLRRIGLDANIVASRVSATMTIPDFFPPQGASIGLVGHDFTTLISLLQERGVAKIMAEPNLIAISGRPAKFNVGGKAAYVAGVGIGQVQIGWEEFGTRVDFMPIVLGNGTIRLEVRPSVSSVSGPSSWWQWQSLSRCSATGPRDRLCHRLRIAHAVLDGMYSWVPQVCAARTSASADDWTVARASTFARTRCVSDGRPGRQARGCSTVRRSSDERCAGAGGDCQGSVHADV
jgi:hypothetical protein